MRHLTAGEVERRRAITAIGAAGVAVMVVLALGGAVSLTGAAAGVAALIAFCAVYWIGAAQTDRRSKRARQRARDGAARSSAALAACARAERMLEISPDPIFVVGRSGRIEVTNGSAREWYRSAREHVLLSSVIREPAVLEAVNEALHGGPPQTVDFMTMAPRERHLRAFVAPVGAAAMVVLYDETAAKRAERTRVDFLANASHQLRTPLASMSGFIETLRGHARDDADARERFLEIMQAQAERMARLIDDLLSLSRVELNEHVPPTGAACLVDIAGDVADAIAPLAAEREVTVTVERRAPRAPVLGDREELLQVVQNLVDNAVKYCRRGGRVSIEVGCGAQREAAAWAGAEGLGGEDGAVARMSIVGPPQAPSGSFAWLRVRDEGPGIARRHLPRLAERFYRADETVSEHAGTGLGLAIAKHIMSRHRGGLAVESGQGRGSAFTIYAPHTMEFIAELDGGRDAAQ